jgi:bacterioferritin-associated ferredoxin
MLKFRRRGGISDAQQRASGVGPTQADIVCHCMQVTYDEVRRAVAHRAKSIADVQRKTRACTRCFGCRFEIEALLREELGDRFHHQARVVPPKSDDRVRVPQPMYMPVLAGYKGYDIDTRLIVFNWEGAAEPAGFRLDLLLPDAERVGAWREEAASGRSAVIDLSRARIGHLLLDGLGLAKIVLDRPDVGSLRPYFHLRTPTSVTTTHEKKGPKNPSRHGPRTYHWLFPIGRSTGPEEVYFHFVNTQLEPMRNQRLLWQSVDGESVSIPLPPAEFEQTVVVPLHEHVPSVADGSRVGTVRLDPPLFKVAGFMLRHDPKRQLWRVQHL